MRWRIVVGTLLAPAALGLLAPVEAQRFSEWSPAVNLGPTVNTNSVDG